MQSSILSPEKLSLDKHKKLKLDPRTAFYRKAFELLNESGIPFLVGGAYALQRYTEVTRDTKDIDIFLYRRDLGRALEAVAAAGYRTELTFPHWLGKVFYDDYVVDIIFNSGNGINEVDKAWFEYSTGGEFFGVPVKFIPPEEMIWSKAFIMERDRFDGADINHMLIALSPELDWERLLERFGDHWRVLYSYLVVFGFVYPSERNLIPQWVMRRLAKKLEEEIQSEPPRKKICQGTLLSHSQYRIDVEERGFLDSRLPPLGNMTKDEIAHWMAAFEEKQQ